MQRLKIYNTLSRKIEEIYPLTDNRITLYSCGPTVYDYTHLGHIRTYINNDILKRTLEYLGYKVIHTMNITDVGHLTDDADFGEDKLEKGAEKHNKTVWEVAEYFTNYFFYTIKQVNIKQPSIICKATEHINQMIDLIKKLEEKGYTYQTSQAVYFDIRKFKDYGKLSGQSLEEKLSAVREEVVLDPEKKHPADFALWFKRTGRFANHTMHWPSPWGDGFPGWHIECSAMSMHYLGETIDIHTGGEDHIPVHHENEIAQSEAATGKPFVRFWVHYAFLLVNGEKMSKSKQNFYTIDDILKQGFHPLALRLHFLSGHYRQQFNFTFKALKATENSYKTLLRKVEELKFINTYLKPDNPSKKDYNLIKKFEQNIIEVLSNDLNTPKALAKFWNLIDLETLNPRLKLELILRLDQILGLRLESIKPVNLTEDLKKLIIERESFKGKKQFDKADNIREMLNDKGFEVKDTKLGTILLSKTTQPN
ncbi:MAG: cysteine--tRNA ligase [Patescibacteria group bacterium]|nr:MAG: cysteine--tRNA ligase [Patescibacteria group bacterium]